MAEVFYFHVQEDRSIKYKLPEPIMQEDKDVATWRFRIPKVLNEIDMSQWAWWFVYVNANGQEFSELLTLTDDIDEPASYSMADYDIDYGISKFPGSFSFALEAISTEQGGEISGEWHTKTYKHKVDGTLQGNQAEYSETESDIISALMQEVRNKVNQLVGGATPLTVNLKSLMTDHDKVYLYTGSEDGESTGYWYYYNGTAWTAGGLYGAGVQIDPTPTQGSNNAVRSGGVYEALDDTTSELGKVKNQLKKIGDGYDTFASYANFEHYGLNPDGTFKTTQIERVSCEDHIIIDRDITVHVKNGYRWGYIPFTDDVPGGYSGWKTSDTMIPAGTEFVIQIAKVDEIQHVVADVPEFVSALTFSTQLLEKITENKNSISILNSGLKQLRRNISTFEYFSDFQHYGLNTDGTYNTNINYRVSCENHILLTRPITVSVKTGFKWSYIPFTNGTAGTLKGWYTSEQTMLADMEFVIQIARVNENVDEIADINEFLEAITFVDDVSYRIQQLEQTANKESVTFTSADIVRGVSATNGTLILTNARLCVNRMLPVKKGDVFKYKTNIMQIGFGVYKDGQLAYYSGWKTASSETTYVIQNDGDFFVQFRKSGDPAVYVEDYDAECTLYYGIDYHVSKNTEKITMMESLYPTQFEYSYDGDYINTKPKKYSGEYTNVHMPSNATVGSTTAQGFGIWNDKIIQLYNPGKAAIIDMADDSVVSICDSNSGHGNTIDFLDDYYDSADLFPKAIIADGVSATAYEVRIQTTGFIVLKTIVFPNVQSGYFVSTMLDKLNKIIYTVGYAINNYINPTNNHMIITKWDYNNLTDNGDDTYTPTFIDSFTLPFISTLQGPTFFNGKLFIISSISSLTDAKTTIYVINPYEKRIESKITQFDSEIQNKETEAMYFYDGSCYMKTGDSNKTYYKLMFA